MKHLLEVNGIRFLGLVVVLCLFGSSAEATNLLQNGSFELIGNNPILREPLWSLEREIPGWTVTGAYVEIQQRGLYGPGDRTVDGGHRWAEIDIDTRTDANPNGNPTLVQTIDTIIGATYQFSGFYSTRTQVEWQDAAVFVDGQQGIVLGGRGGDFSDPHISINGTRTFNLAQVPNPQFVPFSFQFVAAGEETEIGLGSLFTQTPIINGAGQITGFQRPAGGGNLFDALSVTFLAGPPPVDPGPDTEVPEPLSMLLLGSALAGGMVVRRKGEKQLS